MYDFESWEDHCHFHDQRDYVGLVAYCKDEVKRSPSDLYAAERLLQAFVLNGDFNDAIDFGSTLERDHPGLGMFSHHILDALFAIGKTEADFDWADPPSIIRLDQRVSDDCYEFLRPKRKPRTLDDFHTELWLHDYVVFSDEELLHYFQRDERFVVNGDSPVNAEITVVRKRKKAEPDDARESPN
ncbi:hypothetical protein NHH03_00020 [Stieleria sp. TO1_6]|uniref:hypothetical protein n=1 Tax=Stieleria tagensis TaxID=2956795 RepID=UPI00209B62F2|nr:hypothetical protein [Stieleria tagensis]MCO8120104.1 hypothetical protein [Stieleria tagensis]